MEEKVFYEWKDQPQDEDLHRCRELLEDIQLTNRRRWHEKDAGHNQVYRYQEIVFAPPGCCCSKFVVPRRK